MTSRFNGICFARNFLQFCACDSGVEGIHRTMTTVMQQSGNPSTTAAPTQSGGDGGYYSRHVVDGGGVVGGMPAGRGMMGTGLPLPPQAFATAFLCPSWCWRGTSQQQAVMVSLCGLVFPQHSRDWQERIAKASIALQNHSQDDTQSTSDANQGGVEGASVDGPPCKRSKAARPAAGTVGESAAASGRQYSMEEMLAIRARTEGQLLSSEDLKRIPPFL